MKDIMTDEEYLQHHGIRCPVCRSRDVVGEGPIETDGNIAWQNISCGDCEATWVDKYALVGFELDQNPLED